VQEGYSWQRHPEDGNEDYCGDYKQFWVFDGGSESWTEARWIYLFYQEGTRWTTVWIMSRLWRWTSFFYPTFQVNSLDVVFYIYMNAGINTESDSLRESKNRFEHITNLKQLCFDHWIGPECHSSRVVVRILVQLHKDNREDQAFLNLIWVVHYFLQEIWSR
jgi:hypothetical protein